MKLLAMASTLMLAMSMGAYAQQRLTLEEAVSGKRDGKTIVPIKYPDVSWSSSEAGDMPYDAANTQQAKGHDATSSDGKWAIDFRDRQKVWRYATRGNYYLINLETGAERKLGEGLRDESLMFAKFSPDGKKVAYVSDNNIYVEQCSDNALRKALTTTGCDTIVNGTFDWVYEEEFDCRDGFRWSGDSRYIAYWNSDTSGTGWFDIINNVDGLYPTVQHFPYPKAGTLNSAVRIGFVPVDGDAVTTWLPIPGDLRDNYLPRMEVVPGTNRLMIQQMNRAQNTNRLWSYEIGKSADPLLLTADSDKAWVETNDKIHWLQGNKWFTFTSERDGWRHIYRVSADGRKWTCITKGAFDVVSEVAWDEKRGYIYFIASPENATQRYLYRTRVMGNGQCERISGTEKGQYSYDFSPSCDYAVETFSTAGRVPKYSLLKCDSKGKWTKERTLEENNDAQAAWESLGLNAKEFVKCKSGDLELDAWIIKPKNFDPTKKYPVIDYVYGEPASATVQDRWERTLFWQYLAQEGFVIVSIENRGAAAPRGREWRKCIYGEVGVAASEDQARGIMDLCRQFEWMDSTRLGITGWSGGGSQTLNCMFRYPDVFKTGIAIAFVSDQRLYDTIYQERYMNTPQANPDGYFRGSPINFAEGLKGNLLLVHGTGDDNVHYQSCEKMANELISKGKVFYEMSYPMRTHSISERPGTSLHLRKILVDFWKKNL